MTPTNPLAAPLRATLRWGHLPSPPRGQFGGSGPYFVMITGPPSADQEHALAEQGEGRSAEGLALEHLEPVDVALDDA